MNLRDQASKIINQEDWTDDDIIKLSQIGFKMATKYMDAKIEAGEEEALYNHTRIGKTMEAIEEKMAIGKAEAIGKFSAECSHGAYRSMKASVDGMREVLNQIDGFKIAYYRREKSIDGAITNKS